MSAANPAADPVRMAYDCLVSGDAAAAGRHAMEALHRQPADGDALHMLGLALARQGSFPEAIDAFQRALKIEPRNGALHRNLSAVYQAVHDWPNALEACRQASLYSVEEPALLTEYGECLLQSGLADQALRAFHRALELGADPAEGQENVGRAFVGLKQFGEALESLKRSAEADSSRPSVHKLLADIYANVGYHHLCLRHRQAEMQLKPGDDIVRGWLAVAHSNVGDLETAINLARELIDSGAASPGLHSSYISALLHRDGETRASHRTAHREWALRFGSAPAAAPYANSPDPDRRLRIGYITGELYLGPAIHFLLPFLRNHDRGRFEVVCFHTNTRWDAWSATARAYMDRWHCVAGMAPPQVAELVRKEEIDILMDLSGHYGADDLLVFPWKPAPVQGVFPNYPATTGLSSIDFIVTDAWVCPPGSEDQYTEKAVWLPSGYLPYEAPAGAPEVTPLPALQTGVVTYGLFQRPTKLNPPMWDAIAAILRRQPESQLLIHYAASELDIENGDARLALVRQLERRGIPAYRIRFAGPRPLAEHLRLIAGADISLDTYPYNGQTTTSECLWMGVPVVSLRGDTHVARVGYCILDRSGFPEFVVDRFDEYVNLACSLSADLTKLSAVRAGMRERVRQSIYLDGVRMTRELEAVYRAEWRAWCARRAGTGIAGSAQTESDPTAAAR